MRKSLIFQEISRIFKKSRNAAGCGRMRPDAAGRSRTWLDAAGRGRTQPDAAGRGRMRPDAAGCGRMRPDAAGCGRIRPDAARCGRMCPNSKARQAFGITVTVWRGGGGCEPSANRYAKQHNGWGGGSEAFHYNSYGFG